MANMHIYGKVDRIHYKGRLLGLISKEEYAGIIDKPVLRNRIVTVETAQLKNIGKMSNILGYRLIMVIKKRNDEAVVNKALLVTEPLEHISSVESDREVTFVGSNGSYIIVTEDN